jgi:hypothetical protein
MRAIETGYPRGHQAAILCTTEYFCPIFRRESRCPQSETDQRLVAPFWPGHTAIFSGIPRLLKPSYSGNPAIGCTQADDIGPELHKLWPRLVALRHENPALTYHLSHSTAPALTMGDLLPRSQWKKTAVFNEFYSKLDMQERLSVSLPFARPDSVGVVAHRIRRGFTERDRTVLNLVRFHISEACRTAKMHVASPSASIVDSIASLVGGNLVALNSSGTVQYCSDLSQRCFETFFPQEKPFHSGLPATVERWVRREIAAF